MHSRRLQTFDIYQQQFGDFLEGGRWLCSGCGTFSKPVNEENAKRAFGVFSERLDREFKRCVALVGVLEHQYSGCGVSPVRRHWHFLAYAEDISPKLFNEAAFRIWSTRYGNCDVKEYVPRQGLAHYLAKTARKENFEWQPHNLGLAYPSGREGIQIMDPENPYIPEHAREMSRGQTLRLRQLDGLTLRQSRNTGGGDGRDR